MTQYYLHDGLAQQGPYAFEELKDQVLKPDTLIWFEGNTDWKRASEIDELKSLFTIAPPLPVSASPPPLPNLVENQESKPKRSRTLLYVVSGIVVVLAVIGYLLYQNSKHQEEIANVQSALEQKNIEAEEQRLAQLQKEKEAKDAADVLEIKNQLYRNGWKKYVILTGSKYMTSGLGGISDLDLTVSNNTEYALDNVEVQVDYIKASGGIYKTEKIAYDIIPAGTKKTLPAPTSDRGTSVNVRIQKIKAAAFHFCYDHDYRMETGDHGISTSPNGISGNPADPWKCN